MSYRGQVLKRSAVAMIGAVALVIPAIASGSGYPTKLGKHTYFSQIMIVKLAGEKGGTIAVEGITNGRGQVTKVSGEDIEHVPIKCNQGIDRVGSDSLASVEVLGRVSHSGDFSYKENLTAAGFPGIKVAVHGRFVDHGKKIKGTAVVSETPSPASQPTSTGAEDTGCTVSKAPHKWSANVHWTRQVS
jgi:hypothetical protein